jgi:nucleotide-binding universal stress UspA family protein
MRRVLVPLDGSPEAASILSEAKNLAGPRGELVLLHDAIGSSWNGTRHGVAESEAVRGALEDLEREAQPLRDQGMEVEIHALVMTDPAQAIDAAIRIYHPDVVACSTHGDGPLGRLLRGGVAWRALAGSSVPMLVKHTDARVPYRSMIAPEPQIMVPLDGSEYAEKALDLAQQLADEWRASIWLVRVVSDNSASPGAHAAADSTTRSLDEVRLSVKAYLNELGRRLPGEVNTRVLYGPAVERLAGAVRQWSIGHVVMTSHGRTGLRRALLGSVADGLIQSVDCPVIVIPAHALEARSEISPLGEVHA